VPPDEERGDGQDQEAETELLSGRPYVEGVEQRRPHQRKCDEAEGRQVATRLSRAKPAAALGPSTAESKDMEIGAKPGAERLLASA
jgi:hypothetical protein